MVILLRLIRIRIYDFTYFKLKQFLLPLLQSLVPLACKQGSKIKAGVIKCYKENTIIAILMLLSIYNSPVFPIF